MLLSNIFLTFAFAATSSAGVCDAGLYKALAPLSAYEPAKAFCARKYPPKTTTITARGMRGVKRAATTSTTRVNQVQTTSVVVNTTRQPTTNAAQARVTSQTTQRATTTTKPNKDQREQLLSSLVVQASGVVSTLCSCINPPKTVTVPGTTTTISTTSTTTTTCASTSCILTQDDASVATRFWDPCVEGRPSICDQPYVPRTTTTTTTTTTSRTPGPSCGIPCAAPTITNMRAAPECTALVNSGLSCGLCAADFGYGTNGKCQQCAANGQVCNRSSDCCDPNAECRTVRGSRNYFYDYCEVYPS